MVASFIFFTLVINFGLFFLELYRDATLLLAPSLCDPPSSPVALAVAVAAYPPRSCAFSLQREIPQTLIKWINSEKCF